MTRHMILFLAHRQTMRCRLAVRWRYGHTRHGAQAGPLSLGYDAMELIKFRSQTIYDSRIFCIYPDAVLFFICIAISHASRCVRRIRHLTSHLYLHNFYLVQAILKFASTLA